MPSLNLEAKLRPHLLASVAYFDAEKSVAAVNNSLKYIYLDAHVTLNCWQERAEGM